ncbi:uncharacterized protein PGTG_16524 [Puccinia graminis f. sp. tritici CRL 75-36-700-3]|uniref:Uncharacterized protein n=1 Tax=Puccinia graminis f. sp. tritici (strain CRL 75-36-700-3 / race SCCL) TaxID=418459 RepID=E3L121_PUCGT|nr:uncharacterized protein PGTG_16524 [Puccinia graminis f. sp. tritici CRL 75-36-700-3]EFP90246.2 hypothetical protein PGTG_16524 [Puccinia graminis f. sp. tritici CRL 75-36-700-3]
MDNPWGSSEPGGANNNRSQASQPAIIPPATLQAQIEQIVKAAVDVSLKSAAGGKKSKPTSTPKATPVSRKVAPESSHKSASKGKAPAAKKVTITPSKSPPPVASTSRRFDRARSAPPEINTTVVEKPKKPRKSTKESPAKAPARKRNPRQMQTGDFPASYAGTKAIFIHVKVLWGLLKSDSVPEAPDLRDLQEFYDNFSREDHVNQVASFASSGRELIDINQVQILKDARAGRIRIGNSYLHVGDNFIRYAKGLMARFGFRKWCPNLEEDCDSLYNAACRIAAVTTFQELAGAKAYAYLNIDREAVQNMGFLIQCYNHFVHYLMLEKYKKENKEKGKLTKEVQHKSVQKNRERLAASRLEFATLNKFPSRYIKILTPIAAHSDDEVQEGKGFFKIKTLPYRSKNANRFFRRLDICMLKAAEQDPSKRRRVRKLPKNPEMSAYTAAPKGLPIDFYDPEWYHNLTPAQQQLIPDLTNVAFLPNASESLLPKAQRHPHESSKDKTFTRIYFEQLAEPYGLVASTTSEESGDEEGEGEGDGDDEEGEGIDLDGPSPDASEDKFFEEGDAGDLYNDDFVEEDGGDDESDGDEDYEEDSNYEDPEHSGDHEPMQGVEEDEPVW